MGFFLFKRLDAGILDRLKDPGVEVGLDSAKGRDQFVEDDIRAVVEAARPTPVKVILEAHYLSDDQITRGCRIAVRAGNQAGLLWMVEDELSAVDGGLAVGQHELRSFGLDTEPLG